MKTVAKNFIIVLLAMLVGAATVIGYLNLQPSSNLVAQVASAEPSAAPSKTSLLDEDAISTIYQNLSPAVVYITSTSAAPRSTSPIVPDLPNRQQRGTGSGVVVDNQGHILTNNHVVDGATKLDVALANGTTVQGKVLGTDPGNDLAVVKIEVDPSQLTVAPLGDSSILKVGQLAIAIGNPFGLDRTLTVGVVSSVGRTYGTGAGGRPIRDMIQTDAAINPGNSGGPLINSKGEVIGINSSIESPVGASVGIGFAVPINAAKNAMADMIAGKKVAHSWLGISGTSVTPTLATELNIPAEGVYVVQVTADSPAARAGLKGTTHGASVTDVPTGGDVILSVDGKKVAKVEDISSCLDTKKPGDTVTLSIRRDGQTQNLSATLAEWPQTPAQ